MVVGTMVKVVGIFLKIIGTNVKVVGTIVKVVGTIVEVLFTHQDLQTHVEVAGGPFTVQPPPDCLSAYIVPL